MPERLLTKPHQFLNADEVRRLVAACTEPTRTIVLLAIMTGLRIGEILALRWKRIDFVRETLVVAETCYRGRFGAPKTRASKREVPLSSDVVEALKTPFLYFGKSQPRSFGIRHSQRWSFSFEQFAEQGISFGVQARWAPEIELAFTSPHSWDSSGNTAKACPSPTWAFRLGNNS